MSSYLLLTQLGYRLSRRPYGGISVGAQLGWLGSQLDRDDRDLGLPDNVSSLVIGPTLGFMTLGQKAFAEIEFALHYESLRNQGPYTDGWNLSVRLALGFRKPRK